jgi:hypothetical protein
VVPSITTSGRTATRPGGTAQAGFDDPATGRTSRHNVPFPSHAPF